MKIHHFIPFDPINKRTEASVETPDNQSFRVTKGAPQVILSLSDNKEMVKDDVESAINDFAQRGVRSLGVARTDSQEQWQFLGVLPLYDSPFAHFILGKINYGQGLKKLKIIVI